MSYISILIQPEISQVANIVADILMIIFQNNAFNFSNLLILSIIFNGFASPEIIDTIYLIQDSGIRLACIFALYQSDKC